MVQEIVEKMIDVAESKNLEPRHKAGEKRVREETTGEVKRTKLRKKHRVEHKVKQPLTLITVY